MRWCLRHHWNSSYMYNKIRDSNSILWITSTNQRTSDRRIKNCSTLIKWSQQFSQPTDSKINQQLDIIGVACISAATEMELSFTSNRLDSFIGIFRHTFLHNNDKELIFISSLQLMTIKSYRCSKKSYEKDEFLTLPNQK